MVVSLWGAAVAGAAWEPPPGRIVVDQNGPQWVIDRAMLAANVTWKYPCGGRPYIKWTPLVGAYGVAWPDQCVIEFNSERRFDWRALCHAAVHEVGHLAHAIYPDNVAAPWHSLNPKSVMYGGMAARTDPDGVYVLPRRKAHKRCRRL